ncbi:MAG: hypothetical protein ACREJU_02270 [Nitrospiraceae bacterium]
MQNCRFLIGLGILMYLTACTSPIYPVTTGSYRSLPKQPERLMVWGTEHAEAQSAVAAWLQKRGLTIIDRQKLQQALAERAPDSTLSQDEKSLLQAARSIGVDTLVFVDASRMATPTPQGAARPGDPTTLHSTSIIIRGVDVKTGDVEWNAQASYSPTDHEKDGAFMTLACQALATVWGFRPAGYHKVSSSDMCHVNTPDEYGPHSGSRKQFGFNTLSLPSSG